MNIQAVPDPQREVAKQKLTELRRSRRLDFGLVNENTGDIVKWTPVVVSSMASIMTVPILFSLAYVLVAYTRLSTHDYQVQPLSLLSALQASYSRPAAYRVHRDSTLLLREPNAGVHFRYDLSLSCS